MAKGDNLDVITNQLEKKYGNVLQWLGKVAERKREIISTGCLSLDSALGIGGLERGLLVEVFGPPGSGKSFLAYSTIREALKLGHRAAIIDAEHSLDPGLLVKFGLDPNKVLIANAYSGEENIDITQALMETQEFPVIVIDSVAALIPTAEVEASMDQQSMGLHARLMSRGVRKLAQKASDTGTLLIFVNQTRQKIGEYGNPETPTGGNALPYYAAFRIKVLGGNSKSSRLLDESTGEVYGHRVSFEIIKNKRSAPYRKAEVDLIYGIGYDGLGEIVDLSSDLGIVEKSGAWFKYADHKFQGKDKFKVELMSNADLRNDLSEKIRNLVLSNRQGLEDAEPTGKER